MEKSNTAKSDQKMDSSSNEQSVEKTGKKRRSRHKRKNVAQVENVERKTETSESNDNITNEENVNISKNVPDLTVGDVQVESETSPVVAEKKGKHKHQKNKSNVEQGTNIEQQREDAKDETKNNTNTIEKGAIKKTPSETRSGKTHNQSERNQESDYHKNNIPRNFKRRTITNSSRSSENYSSKENQHGYKSSKRNVNDRQNRQNYGNQTDKQSQQYQSYPKDIKKEVAKVEGEPVKSKLSPEAREFKSQSLDNKSMERVKGFKSNNSKARIMKQEPNDVSLNRRSDETYDSVNSSMNKMSLQNKSAEVDYYWDGDVKTEDFEKLSPNDCSSDLKNRSEDSRSGTDDKNNLASYRGGPRRDRGNYNDTDDGRRDNRGGDWYSKNKDRDSWRSRDSDDTKSSKVKEVNGDLFEAPVEYSLAHCVAEDFRMGSGIAVQFRQQFGRVDDLLAQRAKTGGLAYLEEDGRFIYYLVTKKVSNGKPTLETLERSLNKLKEQILENNVKKLAMPRIGCGLDRLEWREVKPMLNDIFADVDIGIVVYNFQQKGQDGTTPTRDGSRCFINHQQLPLVDIETGTGLLFIGYENGFVTPEIDSLDTKYKFIPDYKSCKVKTGDVFKIEKRKEYLYGLIIAKTENDPFNFVALNKCLKTVRDMNKRDGYAYFGIQAFIDPEDDVLMDKICTLIRNNFNNKIEVWICWPESLKHLMP